MPRAAGHLDASSVSRHVEIPVLITSWNDRTFEPSGSEPIDSDRPSRLALGSRPDAMQHLILRFPGEASAGKRRCSPKSILRKEPGEPQLNQSLS